MDKLRHCLCQLLCAKDWLRTGIGVHDQEKFNHNEKQKWEYSKRSSEITFREGWWHAEYSEYTEQEWQD